MSRRKLRSKAARRGRSSKNKGASGERELAEILSAALGIEIKRKLGAARDGGDDIQIGAFSIECKRVQSVMIERWMEQAIENAKIATSEHTGIRIPVVAWRRNGKPWRVALPLDAFISLLKLKLNIT